MEDGGMTDILLFMLYAAYARTTAEVRVHTANVRAWRAVTAGGERGRGAREADIPLGADTLLYILRVNLRVQKFWTVLKTAEAATSSCQWASQPADVGRSVRRQQAAAATAGTGDVR